MQIFHIRVALGLGLALSVLCTPLVDAQGFFNRKKKKEASEASLFPNSGPATSSEPSAPQDMAIFKDGQPQDVRPTSYILRDGEKIETKRKLFGLRRKKSPPQGEAPAADSNETPSFTPPSQPAPTAAAPTEAPSTLPVGKKPRKFGLPSLPNFSVPKLRKRNGAPIDTSGAEVLVNNGGTLAPQGEDDSEDFRFETNGSSSNSGTKSPPRTEGGSIVYNSWDDIPVKKTSAADQIVRDMKAQEAAHRRKVEEARRKQEEAIKKAQADARIRAIMQGAGPIPPLPPGT